MKKVDPIFKYYVMAFNEEQKILAAKTKDTKQVETTIQVQVTKIIVYASTETEALEKAKALVTKQKYEITDIKEMV